MGKGDDEVDEQTTYEVAATTGRRQAGERSA